MEPPLTQPSGGFFMSRCGIDSPLELALPEPTLDPQDFKFVFNLRPPCYRCGRPLILTRIEPEEAGLELRTYYCAAREDTEVVMVPI